MKFIILLLVMISLSFLKPQNTYSIYSQTYFQYDFYTSENIKGFNSGFFIPNVTLGFNLNVFDSIPFFRIIIHMDVSYFQFDQNVLVNQETSIVNTEKVFETIENNILTRLKEIQDVKRELRLISLEKINTYKEEFERKLTIQFQTNLNETLLKISEDFVPKEESQANIIKKAFAGILTGFANNINFAKPIVSLIPGVGQAAAAVLPMVEGTLNTISGIISSTIEQSIEPDTDAYKAGTIVEKLPGISWIGSIIKAAEEEKLRLRLIRIRQGRLSQLDISVAKYRSKAQRAGGLTELKEDLKKYKNIKLELEKRYDFLALSKVIIEEEASINLEKMAYASAGQQTDSEMNILRNRLEKEERSIKKEAEDIAQKRSIREAEIESRIQDDKYIRIPIAIGSVFAFKIAFFVPYIETSFVLSIDHSYRTEINKVHPGFRFGAGLQFEFFDGRLFFGVNFRYWLIHNSFYTFGPRIGFRI